MKGKRTKWLAVLCMLLIAAGSMGIAFAGEGFSPDGNERRGKYMYRKNCRSCHDGSSAKELQPNTKTQAQWQSDFDGYKELECTEEWDKLSRSQLGDIFTYLFKHAYDSAQPATCG
ncbi:MAG: cytochrome c [Desulfohalobiaceae bacterium]|nr:cytochrome c [Desulfohalobiaceae bacterium]